MKFYKPPYLFFPLKSSVVIIKIFFSAENLSRSLPTRLLLLIKTCKTKLCVISVDMFSLHCLSTSISFLILSSKKYEKKNYSTKGNQKRECSFTKSHLVTWYCLIHERDIFYVLNCVLLVFFLLYVNLFVFWIPIFARTSFIFFNGWN